MDELAISSTNGFVDQNPLCGSNPVAIKKKRNLPGTPDPEAEVIALSPKTLMATNRFLCEICGKGFQRDQNLQLHRRGHNLPWKLKQRSSKEVRKRVYVCPEKTCVHHHPSRALGDLTGIKKHFCRKHGEKKWKCEKCSKRYAVQSDWKAHSKTCGTREYKCDCGTLFSRRDSFITHRAFCDALAEETARVNAVTNINGLTPNFNYHHLIGGAPLNPNLSQHFSSIFKPITTTPTNDLHTSKGLSLWMNQTLTQTPNYQIFNDPPPQPSDYPPHDFNWAIPDSSNSQDDHLITSDNHVKEAEVLQQLVSVPSLFSTQQQSHHHHHCPNSASMSATALLQKAAQIGATSSDPSFLASFGLKCSSSSPQLVQDQGNNNYKFCGLYGSDHDLEINQFQMYPPIKRQKLQNSEQDSSVAPGGGQTRDFLGVGMQQQAICNPSTINGWI
ncbi:zinc finger protein NUTCRACKER [Euphorbia lathyris]|uniref:zinc finger protein NUTCRACKER n=1 Tax=Euphorbia lathyris TaxID=212925 RepID=UPI003313A444